MSRSKQASNALGNEAEITLGLLNVIHENSSITQRSVAGEMGIALGLVNTYLKRCIKKGWVKVASAPANRYLYYLTPHGFTEKSHLTRMYLSYSFNFFRDARQQCSELFAASAENGWKRLALYGISDLAEIATLCAREHPVELVAVIDPSGALQSIGGIRVVDSLKAAGKVDAVMLTDVTAPQEGFEALMQELPRDRILTAKLLGVSRTPPVLMD